jgi:hypothetical protein
MGFWFGGSRCNKPSDSRTVAPALSAWRCPSTQSRRRIPSTDTAGGNGGYNAVPCHTNGLAGECVERMLCSSQPGERPGSPVRFDSPECLPGKWHREKAKPPVVVWPTALLFLFDHGGGKRRGVHWKKAPTGFSCGASLGRKGLIPFKMQRGQSL